MINQNHKYTLPSTVIQYRGYYNGPGDWGGDTPLYPTYEQALTAARSSCHSNADKAWVNPEFTGPLDSILEAKEPLSYLDQLAAPPRRRGIIAGERFMVSDILDPRHTTIETIARWLLDGKAVMEE